MKFADLHSGNHCAFIFENEMHVGMRQALGDVRRATAKIPMNDPVMCDPQRKIGRRATARVPHVSGGQTAPQHTARLFDFGIEELFDFGGSGMSRFSNHCVGREAKVLSAFNHRDGNAGATETAIETWGGVHEDSNVSCGHSSAG